MADAGELFSIGNGHSVADAGERFPIDNGHVVADAGERLPIGNGHSGRCGGAFPDRNRPRMADALELKKSETCHLWLASTTILGGVADISHNKKH